jgi:hypothetical protein
MSLTTELASTDVKHGVIASPNVGGARKIVMGFNNDELGQWKTGVRRGEDMNDWTDLITHRTYISDYWMAGSQPQQSSEIEMCQM